MEFLLLYCLQVFFLYFLVNHAAIFGRVRAAVMPILPRWMRELIECPLCLTFWGTLVMSFLFGFTYFLLCAPPVVLFMDVAYRKLKPFTPWEPPAESPILPPPSR